MSLPKLPTTLYVRRDEDLEGEPLLAAEEDMLHALPEDSKPGVVGIYQLVKIVRVRKTFAVEEEKLIADIIPATETLEERTARNRAATR